MTRLSLQHEAQEVFTFYRRALARLEPIWERGLLDTARPTAKRVAMRIMELTRERGDLLLALALEPQSPPHVATHSLHLAVVAAQLTRHLPVPETLRYEIALYALLHHLGHETRGALASDPGFLAQRSLLTLLLTPEPDTSHYRQALVAFQLDLGQDQRGLPRLELALKLHPLVPLFTLAHDFVEHLHGSPFTSNPQRLHHRDAVLEMKRHPQRYLPTLLALLERILTPAPVGTLVSLDEGRRAIVRRARTFADPWSLELRTLDPPQELLTLTPDSPRRIVEMHLPEL